MTLYDRLLRQRAVILVATIGLMLAGVLAVTRLGTGIYPEVEFPRIVVVARASDLPPEEMQAAVVRPLEESLAAVLGLRRLRVRINRGASELALQFADGTDMWRALQLVDAAVSEARPSLPPGVEIETQKVTPADFPILSYNLVGGNATERREVAEQVVRRGQAAQSGLPALQIIAPRSMRAEAMARHPESGKNAEAKASSVCLPADESMAEVTLPQRARTRMMLVSSTTACSLWAKARIAAAV